MFSCVCVNVWTHMVYHNLCKMLQFKSGSGGVNLQMGGVYDEPWDPPLTQVCAWVCFTHTCMCVCSEIYVALGQWVCEDIYGHWQGRGGRVCVCVCVCQLISQVGMIGLRIRWSQEQIRLFTLQRRLIIGWLAGFITPPHPNLHTPHSSTDPLTDHTHSFNPPSYADELVTVSSAAPAVPVSKPPVLTQRACNQRRCETKSPNMGHVRRAPLQRQSRREEERVGAGVRGSALVTLGCLHCFFLPAFYVSEKEVKSWG